MVSIRLLTIYFFLECLEWSAHIKRTSWSARWTAFFPFAVSKSMYSRMRFSWKLDSHYLFLQSESSVSSVFVFFTSVCFSNGLVISCLIINWNLTMALRVNNPSLHSYSLTGKSDERTGGMKRRSLWQPYSQSPPLDSARVPGLLSWPPFSLCPASSLPWALKCSAYIFFCFKQIT